MHETPSLSPEQERYWREQLDFAERAVAYAKKRLGIAAVEKTMGSALDGLDT